MTAQEQQTTKLQSIFMPYAVSRRTAMLERNGRFVHYTSAANALSIIENKQLWMRNSNCMSDFREVQHGFDRLNSYFQDQPKRDAFFGALNAAASGIAEEAVGLFNGWWNDIRLNTYIASVSEHQDDEDQHGRLSMWRAFSRKGPRVALVMRLPLTEDKAQSLNLLFSPVAYFTEAQLDAHMAAVVSNIRSESVFLRSADRTQVVSTFFYMLTTGVVCAKHEGFHEEQEWRLIYSPNQRPSNIVSSSIEVVDGVPQTMYKIPLTGAPPNDLAEIDVPHILDRIIIGASQYPWPMLQAFVACLQRAGVPNAEQRVWTSGIPIRT